MTAIKPFARQGSYTAVDNAVFDEIMPLLSGAEWKILCLIIRKTIGWQKETDGISYSQLTECTGIKSNTTVQKAIASLIERGLIQQGKTRSQTDPHYYRLNKEYTCRVTESVKQPVTFSVKQPVTENVNTKEKEKENNNSGNLAAVFSSYENNIGLLVPHICTQIEAAAGQYPDGWIEDAIAIAASANKRNWRYINGILSNWHSKGRQDIRVNVNGAASTAARAADDTGGYYV